MNIPGHLCAFESALANGAEWLVAADQWLVIQFFAGVGYARAPRLTVELDVDHVVIIPPGSRVAILASRVGRLQLRGIGLRVEALSGVLSPVERRRLESVVAAGCQPFKALPEHHAFALKFKEAWYPQAEMTSTRRVSFLHGFLEFVGPHLHAEQVGAAEAEPDARARLKRFLAETPQSELTTLTLPRLARQLNCGERHASRLFQEVIGCNFQSYLSDVRLEQACQILSCSNLKIIDVAYESGHGSLAAFNLMFKRRFGLTPSEWRRLKRRTNHAVTVRRKSTIVQPVIRAARHALALAACST